MKLLLIFISFFFTLSSGSLYAQKKAMVLVANSRAQDGILVKWYTASVINFDSVDIYRSEGKDDNWQKINDKPIRKLPRFENKGTVDTVIGQLAIFLETADKSSVENSMILYLTYLKTVESFDFSTFLGIAYFDKDVVKGKSYKYKISEAKNSKLMGQSSLIKVKKWQPSDPPENIELKVKTKNVNISWKNEDTVFLGVNVYRKQERREYSRVNKQPVIVMSSLDSNDVEILPDYNFRDDSVEYGNTYYYKLAAIDLFGNETEFSEEYKAEIIDKRAPPQPQDFNGNILANSHKVQLTWAVDNSPKIKGYNVYHCTTLGGTYERLNSSPLSANTNFFEYLISEFGSHFFYVAAVSKNDIESKSALVSTPLFDDEAPLLPREIKATTAPGEIKLTWTKGNEADLLGYNVYRSVASGKMEFNLLTTPVKGNSYIDSLPKNAKNTFIYKLKAVDTAGNQSEFSEVIEAVMPDVLPPLPPTIIYANSDRKAINLKWLPTLDDDLSGYLVFRRTASDSLNWKQITKLSRGTTTLSDSDGTGYSAQYIYMIKAVDSTGNVSAGSNEFGVGTLANKEAPAILLNLNVDVNRKYTNAKLDWNMGKGKSEPILGYIVYKAVTGATLLPITGLITDRSYNDTDILQEKNYSYKVVAYFKNGTKAESVQKEIEAKKK